MAAEDAKPVEEPEEIEAYDDDSLIGQVRQWIRMYAAYWGMSFTVHMVGLSLLLLVFGRATMVPRVDDDVPAFDEPPPVAKIDPPAVDYQLGEPNVDPSELTTESLMDMEPPAQTEKHYDDNPTFVEAGGGQASAATAPDVGGRGGFDVKAFGDGPKVTGGGGIGAGIGSGTKAGSGGDGVGFGGRGQGSRKAMLGRFGGTKETERAVAAALWWLAKHQMKEGNWSLKDYVQMCKDKSCTGPGSEESLSGATAMGLLPFLAAGQTHQSNGPFRNNVNQGIYWLISHQLPDGDLYTGGVAKNDHPNGHCWMYSHGLASIALCECYGMSGDKTVGNAAQKAIDFIQKAQNSKSGGWRYTPDYQDQDTSVVGWQLMALKSAQMAGLRVDPAALAGTEKWLAAVAVAGAGANPSGGSYGDSGYTYQPGGGIMPTMTAVGVLCKQYLHAGRGDPAIVNGIHFLMEKENLPDKNNRNIYYYYYATQCLHNMADKDWDTWNRKMRTILVKDQVREGCASGSWDPAKPSADAWGGFGGRIMVTSLSCLTLEVYYRYLPLYKLDRPEEAPKNGADAGADKAGADKGGAGKAGGDKKPAEAK